MVSVVALLSIAILALLIIRLGAMALTKTGLSRDASTFQAYSAFFGVGFTTREAELVVNHPVRRRIIRDLIIAGNIGFTTALATLVVTFVGDASLQRKFLYIALILGGLLLLVFIANTKVVSNMVDRMISFTLEQAGVVRALDYEVLLRISAGYGVSEVEIDPGHPLVGKTLGEARPRGLGVVVLGIARDDGTYVGVPDGETKILTGDVLTVYGKEEVIKECFHLRGEAREEDEIVKGGE